MKRVLLGADLSPRRRPRAGSRPGRRARGQAPGQRGQEAGAERVADAGRLDLRDAPARPARSIGLLARGARSRTPSAPSVVTRVPTRSRTSSAVQPVFCSISADSYSLENRIAAPSISSRIRSPSPKASCWLGRRRTGSRAGGTPRCGGASPRGRSAPIRTYVGPPTRSTIGASSIVAGLAHRAGVERRDLGHRRVGGAHEAGGVPGLGDVHRVAVDAVPLQPGAVVGEVLADRADEHRPQAQAAEAEARCWPRSRRAGPPGRRPGRTPTACRAGRRRASRRTCPAKVIRWSVAMDPAMSSDMARNTTGRVPLRSTRAVANSVEDMDACERPPPSGLRRRSRRPREMSADCRAVGDEPPSPRARQAAQAAAQPAPSIHFEDYPREVGKREIRVSDAAARLANAAAPASRLSDRRATAPRSRSPRRSAGGLSWSGCVAAGLDARRRGLAQLSRGRCSTTDVGSAGAAAISGTSRRRRRSRWRWGCRS